MTVGSTTIVQEWQQRQSGLDASALAAVPRVLRASHYLQATLDRIAAADGSSHQGDVDVLTDLYRAKSDRGLTLTELAAALLLTAGGMTVGPHRLQDAGPISRVPNPQDGGAPSSASRRPESTSPSTHLTLLDSQSNGIQSLAPAAPGELTDVLRTINPDRSSTGAGRSSASPRE